MNIHGVSPLRRSMLAVRALALAHTHTGGVWINERASDLARRCA